jgi:hypothetical protein
VEWLKVKALCSNPSTTKKKKKKTQVVHTCNPSYLRGCDWEDRCHLGRQSSKKKKILKITRAGEPSSNSGDSIFHFKLSVLINTLKNKKITGEKWTGGMA